MSTIRISALKMLKLDDYKELMILVKAEYQ